MHSGPRAKPHEGSSGYASKSVLNVNDSGDRSGVFALEREILMTTRLTNERKTEAGEAKNSIFGLSRHISRPKPHLRCPKCRSILYTRRHPKCGVCENELPEDLLFSATEAERIKALMIVEQEKHRDWLAKAGSSWR